MEDDNEDNLKNKEDLHIAGRQMALDIFRFAVFFWMKIVYNLIDVLQNFRKNWNVDYFEIFVPPQ